MNGEVQASTGDIEGETARELIDLCRTGRLYEVEAWIRAGKPVNAPPDLRKSPLIVAVEKGFHSLVELLMKNGANPHANGNALELAVDMGNDGIVRLLLDHGADPTTVNPQLVCRCGNLDVVRLFLDRGVDLTRDNGFAVGLVETKKALLGVFRSYRERFPQLQRQADIALRYCCREGRIGGVYRLLWARANPLARVPDLDYEDDDPEMWSTALEAAVFWGHHEIVKRIGVDAARDDLNSLLHRSTFTANPEIIRYLAQNGADINHREDGKTTCLVELFRTLHWNNESIFQRGSSDSSRTLEAIYAALELGAKWERGDGQATHFARSGFYALSDRPLLSLLGVFRKHGVCPDSELIRLLDTPRMVKKLEGDLKPFVKMFPGWRRAQKRHAEIEGLKRMGRWRR